MLKNRLKSDLYTIPKFMHDLGYEIKFGLTWVEKRVCGVDCVLYCKFM